MATRKNKPLSRRPAEKPKDVYLVKDKSGTIVKIVSTIQLARKYAPEDGSITHIDGGVWKRDYEKNPAIQEFLKQEAMRGK